MTATRDIPRGGRPRKKDPDARRRLIFARVRPDELSAIHRRAALGNYPTLADYMRAAVLNGRVVARQDADPALLHELARQGNNLNQIARICNQTGEVRRAERIDEILDTLRRVLERLYSP
jgi:hypothetical protein